MNFAGIAQLVERNLAKVEVSSSRLVSRSRFSKAARFMPLAAFSFYDARSIVMFVPWAYRRTQFRSALPAR